MSGRGLGFWGTLKAFTLLLAMSPEQLQYACDLVNEGTRFDSLNPVCKVGKPCNGRCIPHSSQCGGEPKRNASASTSTRVEIEKKYGNLSDEQKDKLSELMERTKLSRAKKEQAAAQRGTLPAHQAVQGKKVAAAMEARKIAVAQALRDRQQAAAEAAARKKLKA